LGVGKSSLINLIDPELDLKVNEISEATDKGRHTTVVREMFPLKGGGFVADLPGLKTLALWDIEPEELDGYFPEIRPLVSTVFTAIVHTDLKKSDAPFKKRLKPVK
jgi:ribosome biogenesis GTPase